MKIFIQKITMPAVIFLSLLICPIINTSFLHAQNEFSVFEGWKGWSDPGTMLARCLNRQAMVMLEKRSKMVSNLRTAEDWNNRKEEIWNTLYELVGPFPEKTPLNPRITGVLEKGEYRVEKIVLQSQPGFYVTGVLFLPSSMSGKTPAILNPIGHSAMAFRRPLYQQLILNLVHKGFIVFAYDPIGQGERLQYFNPETGESDVGGSTAEHSYVGMQNFLIGSNLARYKIWDGMRCIDYLLSRPEVDPERIGVTGLSGGGTLSSYIGAFDRRVLAAAPTCYITGFTRLLPSIGPQDAEQNFPSGIAHSIDHADLLEVRAPKPTLLVATTRDFFSIQGARETAAEVERAFEAFGKPDNFAIAEDDFGHGYTVKNREAIYRFFRKALELPGDTADREYRNLTYDELQITKTGQVSTSLGSETVFSLHKREAEKVFASLEQSRKNLPGHLMKIKDTAEKFSGYRDPLSHVSYISRGRVQHKRYNIEYFALDGEEGMVIPLLLFVPHGDADKPAVIYCNSRGKEADAGDGGLIEWLVGQGHLVAAVDLSGTGETEDGRSIFNPFRALQIGRSIPGIQAGDIIRTLRFLLNRNDVRKDRIGALAVGEAGPALLHAAVFDKNIRKIALAGAPVSYRSIATSLRYDYDLAVMIPGVLTGYDLPDCAAALAPRALLVVNGADNTSFPTPLSWVENEMSVTKKAYSIMRGEFTIKKFDETKTYEQIYGNWLNN